jgi:hypothetical protein
VAGPPLYEGNCNYTPSLSTLGTQTVAGGDPAGQPGRYGVLYGYNLVSAGTAAMVVTYYDVVTDVATQGVTTNTLFVGTASAAGAAVAPLNGVGVRFRGNLVLVTTGTVGNGNTLWD